MAVSIESINASLYITGLDRYYYIQFSHPEAEGQSSVLFNLHGYGSNALAQMHVCRF